MHPLPPRLEDIMEIARNSGRVDVEGLSRRFSVTAQTIRKDLNDLCNQGLLHRVHGGAVFPSNTTNVAYLARQEMAATEKSLIARAAAQLIPDNSSLILNIGTTTEEVSRHLLRHEGLMVITNNLNVAVILSGAPGIELVLAGGMVRKTDGGIVGEPAVEMMTQFKVDFAIIGTSGIDEEGGLFDYDYQEVQVTKAIIQHSRHTILVADATKFQRHAPVRIGSIGLVDTFITDRCPPKLEAHCKEAGTSVIKAGNAVFADILS